MVLIVDKPFRVAYFSFTVLGLDRNFMTKINSLNDENVILLSNQ